MSIQSGTVFNYLTITSNTTDPKLYLPQCICGIIKQYHEDDLKSGTVISCGCKPRNNNHKIDLTGQVFNNLKVIKRLDIKNKSRQALFECLCLCGNLTPVIATSRQLREGRTTSCGCKRFGSGNGNYKHGMTDTAEYRSYNAMISRCYNVNNDHYKYYGGRINNPVTVCDNWLGENGFIQFINDMGLMPDIRYSIERIDVYGNYEPSNCEWIPLPDQNRNQTTTVFNENLVKQLRWDFEVNLMCFTDLCNKYHYIKPSTISNVIYYNAWNDIDILAEKLLYGII